MPLTESESRQQRISASSKNRSKSTDIIHEPLTTGTAINPRERPRGLLTPSISMMNFHPTINTTSQQVQPARLNSAVQLMFDDNFSSVPLHASSLTNIEKPNIGMPVRLPTSLSFASNGMQQPFLLPPPSSSGSIRHRSSSQTINTTANHSHFHSASSVDALIHTSASLNDESILFLQSATNPVSFRRNAFQHHTSMNIRLISLYISFLSCIN
jgi:hypothetical protein